MGNYNIDSAVASSPTDPQNYSVQPSDTDGPSGLKDTEYQNTDWTTDYGYYKAIPEFKIAVKTKATWTVGAGFTADMPTTILLGTIRGNGKESFNSILKNLIRLKTISKDSFGEVVRDPKNNGLVNIKVLNPGRVKIVQDSKGMIRRYNYMNGSSIAHKFKPEDIFHLSHDRNADEIHGERVVDTLMWLIKKRNEAMDDYAVMLHRNIDPLWTFKLATDDETEINTIKNKYNGARKKGENLFIPKDTVEAELQAVSANSVMNPVAWINMLNDYFFQAVMVPQIVLGNAKEFTDASGKIVYLAYEQSVKTEQLYIEEQILNQLNLEVHLTFPASLQNELISDNSKQPDLQASQPADTTAEIEGKE